MSQPLVSVVVPTHNDGTTIELCVRSLLEQDWEQLEILVVCDGCTDNTVEVLSKLRGEDTRLRTFVLPGKRGAARARNVAFREAQGEILALIDGDMWAPSDWVSSLVKPILDDEADVTGGPDRVPPQAHLVSRCIGYSMDSFLTNAGLRMGDTKLVAYLPGTGNMAIGSHWLERAGLFDEEFHDTGEDKEWLYRVKSAGGRFLYLPQALAWHERRADLLLHARKQALSGRRRFDIWLKDPATFEFPHLAPGLLVLFLLIGPVLGWLRPLWWAAIGAGGMLLMADCFKGARALQSWRAFPILMVSSAVIPLGYGAGLVWRAAQELARRVQPG